ARPAPRRFSDGALALEREAAFEARRKGAAPRRRRRARRRSEEPEAAEGQALPQLRLSGTRCNGAPRAEVAPGGLARRPALERSRAVEARPAPVPPSGA